MMSHPQRAPRWGLIPTTLLALVLGLLQVPATAGADELSLVLRKRVEAVPESGQFTVVNEPARWDPSKTAVIICDMWAKHWCTGATSRGAEMAPRMNELIKAARQQGVHTNMCVIGRPFGLRNMVRFGKNVILVRDLTDTMYNSRRWPFVSHFRGTDLIVEHIEKYVCPTITSDQLLGGEPLRFQADVPDVPDEPAPAAEPKQDDAPSS